MYPDISCFIGPKHIKVSQYAKFQMPTQINIILSEAFWYTNFNLFYLDLPSFKSVKV